MVFNDRETIFFEHLNKLLSSCTIRPLCPGLFAKHYNKSFCTVNPLLTILFWAYLFQAHLR